MRRPCGCDRVTSPDWSPDQCRPCWLFRHDPRYRALWTGAPPGLGDEVEALIKSVGLDRLAKAYEKVTGRKCRCDQRRALLNKLPAVLPKVRALLGVGIPHDAEVGPAGVSSSMDGGESNTPS